MGRRKNLSEEELLDRAMHVFRRDGFAGASAEVLVRETGASRYNLYSSYGNKEGLFTAALDRYNQEIIDTRFGPLEQPNADLDDILALLEFYGAAGSGPVAGLGCLLCNSAVEFGGRFDIEAANPDLQCATHLRGAFADAGKHDLGRISTGRQYTFQLPYGDDIETGAEAGEHVEYAKI